jgi:DNA-binding response OmpR family regulator
VNVLIVDPGGGRLLAPLVSELRRRGHSLEFEEDTQGLLERLSPPRFQVVVAPYDLDDPPVSNLVERLRRSGRLVPFVAAVDEGGAKAEPGLLAGGVDFVVDVREPAASAARLVALARLATRPAVLRRVDVGGLVVDEGAAAVELEDGETVPLTKSEARLLTALAVRLGQIVGRQELMALVWGEGASPSDNALESVVKRLRPKLGAQASRLSSVRLRGYVLEAPAA